MSEVFTQINVPKGEDKISLDEKALKDSFQMIKTSSMDSTKKRDKLINDAVLLVKNDLNKFHQSNEENTLL
jgi:hypothetical protein